VGPTSQELQEQLESAQQQLIEKSKNKDTNGVQTLIDQIQSIQNSLELGSKVSKAIQLSQIKLDETKRLLMQPLTNFNDVVFRSQVQRTLVMPNDRGKPSKLKFIFAFGPEIEQSLC